MSYFAIPGQSAVQRRAPAHIFLEGATEKEWQAIYRHAEVRQFEPGDVLVRLGDTDSSFFILTAGTAEVLLRDERVVGTVSEGAVFGEIAFFDGAPRSATVRATTKGSAAYMSRESFETFAAWEPALARRMLLDLGKALATRLRDVERRTGA